MENFKNVALGQQFVVRGGEGEQFGASAKGGRELKWEYSSINC